MKGNVLKVIAAFAALGSTMAFAQTHHKSWYHAVTHRSGSSHRSHSDYVRDQSYMAGLRRHHEYQRLEEFQEREGYSSNRGHHYGWTKGHHNKHHGVGPGHYSG